MATIVFEESLEIPDGIRTLADFRRWTYCEDFPENGRIDYVKGRIEIDMAPEAMYSHGRPKVELVVVIGQLVKQLSAGDIFTDRMRISSVPGEVSAEPDLVFISNDSIESGRVKLIPKAAGEEEDFIEIEGSPDLIVEVVSDSSVAKDTKRLPKAYFDAGVPEFWLIDARRQTLLFRIHRRGKTGYVPQRPDRQGYQRSAVLNQRFRLDRHRDSRGHWQYDLLHAE
ncbi:MAG: Uma2 family endonuclease [Pirellulales bacterium]